MIHVDNRDKLIEELRGEIVGPMPLGDELDCAGDIVFASQDEYRRPYRQMGTGEEILQRDAPLNRYGAGILYPYGERGGEEETVGVLEPIRPELDADDQDASPISAAENQRLGELLESTPSSLNESDLDLSAANKYLPSSMGISFVGQFDRDSELVVSLTGGRYVEKNITVDGQAKKWYLRVPVRVEARFDGADILGTIGSVRSKNVTAENLGELELGIEVFSRSGEGNERLLTVTAINRTSSVRSLRDYACLFQSHFNAHIGCGPELGHIVSYPEVSPENLDEEEESLTLLYRKLQTFAVGHGCSADWDAQAEGFATSVSAEAFPVVEIPSVTPDIMDEDGKPISISMGRLSNENDFERWASDLAHLADAYDAWIEKKAFEANKLSQSLSATAGRHLTKCRDCSRRIREGIELLGSDPLVRKAFSLANMAVLMQQVRGGREPRAASVDRSTQRLVFSAPFIPVGEESVSGRGQWRAFQIAFLLMNLQSTGDGDASDRNVVELIWFPTGGGKTEAYLGLTAYSIFMRRLRNRDDDGVSVLMRYTLRLLTAQQFQRACGLICAMEYLRRGRTELLGDKELSIAVWLGGDVTPNSRDQALKSLKALGGAHSDAENVFLLLRCPWCRAQMGRLEKRSTGRRGSNSAFVLGYEQSGSTVVFKCPDNECDFRGGLPIVVIDDDIYAKRPSLVIGTVDKFASLAWNSRARALFGIDENGSRFCSPPGLIIQDELHLISGPLGSMVGLFEVLVEELSTDRRHGGEIKPKIVSSTATIRRFEDQILGLYGRTEVMLFPPPGLDQSDSFFAVHARTEDGLIAPGRKYVGINAPGLGSLQNSEVRTYAALLQGTAALPTPEQDPWWTLLVFFNNLRMLGNTLSLLQSNVPDYMKVLHYRTRQPMRYLHHIEELTGRLRSDEVPVALAKLETERKNEESRALDVCLASNIIEVGVDVDRLSLIVIVGQPKSTSQYIQVTGRVGRRLDRPGLVVSIFSPSKPRDRSHFEKFRSYHQRLYAQVEPTSVTPFSPPALERALHAVMAGYARQLGDETVMASPSPIPRDLLEDVRRLLEDRVGLIDPDEVPTLEKMFARRLDEWERWDHPQWDTGYQNVNAGSGLLRQAGSWVSEADAHISWATPNSMRNVDAEARIQITRHFMHGDNN